MKPVMIEWEDITSRGGWQDEDDIINPLRCFNVGFIVEKTKRYIKLCSGYQDSIPESQSCKYLCMWIIPRGCIKKIIRLKMN